MISLNTSPSDRPSIKSHRVVITQSNFLPWRGYFDLIRQADLFVLLDCVQFTRRDWRNRNLIKGPNGPIWITIPVETKGRYNQAIDETLISDPNWSESHRRTIQGVYSKAPAYEDYWPHLDALYQAVKGEERLTNVTRRFIDLCCETLNLDTPVISCDELVPRADLIQMSATERLVAISLEARATHYMTGPAAKDYLSTDAFEQAGIEVEWMDYSGYTAYPQLWGAFEPQVSVIDLILNCGDKAGDLIGQ